MPKQYVVKLREEERAQLLALTRKGKAGARRIKRALVLLRADEGARDLEIVQGVGVGIATVERIRKRLVLEGLEEALSAQPRPKKTPKRAGRGRGAPRAR